MNKYEFDSYLFMLTINCILIILSGSSLKSLFNTVWKQPPEVFYKTAALKNFTVFSGSICIGVSAWRPATLLKRRLQDRCFPANFAKFLGISIFIQHLWLWRMLSTSYSFFTLIFDTKKLMTRAVCFSDFFSMLKRQ